MTMPVTPPPSATVIRRVVTVGISAGVLIFLNALAGFLPLSFVIAPLAVGTAGYFAVQTIKGQW